MKQSLLKTLTFAILHFTTAFLIVYALTGSVVIGGTVALIEPLCNTLVFFLHERAWERFGQRRDRSSHYGHDLLLKYFRGRDGHNKAGERSSARFHRG